MDTIPLADGRELTPLETLPPNHIPLTTPITLPKEAWMVGNILETLGRMDDTVLVWTNADHTAVVFTRARSQLNGDSETVAMKTARARLIKCYRRRKKSRVLSQDLPAQPSALKRSTSEDRYRGGR